MVMSPKKQGPLEEIQTQPLRAPKKPLRECLTQWSPFQARNLERMAQMMTVVMRTNLEEGEEVVLPRTGRHRLKKTLRRQHVLVRVVVFDLLPVALYTSVFLKGETRKTGQERPRESHQRAST